MPSHRRFSHSSARTSSRVIASALSVSWLWPWPGSTRWKSNFSNFSRLANWVGQSYQQADRDADSIPRCGFHHR